jgi:uncharacterized membrane protein
MAKTTPAPETNREAFRRMAREAREAQKEIPAWMRTPPTERDAWDDPARPTRDAVREAEKKRGNHHDD